MKNFLGYCLLIIIPIIISLAMFEFYLHLAKENSVAAEDIKYDKNPDYWTYAKSSTQTFENEKKEKITVKADSNGFRNPSNLSHNQHYLFLGDSFTASIQVPYEQTFTALLRQEGVQIYNAGIDGTSTLHQMHILKKITEKNNFKHVVLFFFPYNDFYENMYHPKHQTIDSILPLHASTENKPDTSKPTATVTPSSVKQAIKTSLHSLCQLSLTCQQVYNNFWLGVLKGYNKDKLRNRYSFLLEAIKNQNQDPKIQQSFNLTEKALSHLANYLKKKNIDFSVVVIPQTSLFMNSYYPLLSQIAGKAHLEKQIQEQYRTNNLSFHSLYDKTFEICKKVNITCHSLLEAFIDDKNKYNIAGLFDIHWSTYGHKKVSNYLLRNNIIRPQETSLLSRN